MEKILLAVYENNNIQIEKYSIYSNGYSKRKSKSKIGFLRVDYLNKGVKLESIIFTGSPKHIKSLGIPCNFDFY
jgi:hypothetical protein